MDADAKKKHTKKTYKKNVQKNVQKNPIRVNKDKVYKNTIYKIY